MPPIATTQKTPLPGGNHFDKYSSKNPLVRLMMHGFMTSLESLARASGCNEIYEVGCGEGRLSIHLARLGFRVRASDPCPDTIALAKKNAADAGVQINFEVKSLFDVRENADLIICCEVLEHLEDPRSALAHLKTLARKNLIVSVPREPLWRVLNLLRLSYLSDLGNTPGHIQHFSKNALVNLVGEFFEIEKIVTPLPWTMALASKR